MRQPTIAGQSHEISTKSASVHLRKFSFIVLLNWKQIVVAVNFVFLSRLPVTRKWKATWYNFREVFLSLGVGLEGGFLSNQLDFYFYWTEKEVLADGILNPFLIQWYILLSRNNRKRDSLG